MRVTGFTFSKTQPPGARSSQDAGQVSRQYYSAAILQGLSSPLNGLHDPRLQTPDVLLDELWAKKVDSGGSMIRYEWKAYGPVVQYYQMNLQDGSRSLGTYIRNTNPNTVETITQGADGKISRAVSPA